jgi:hypothetical protein
MTIAAITPPEGRWEELFASPARADSAGTGEFTPPFTGTVVLPETGLWRAVLDVTAVVVRVRVDRGEDDDVDVDDSMISDEAESVELGTGSERGIGCVAIEVVFPMLDVCTSATTAVGPGGPSS